MQFVCHNNLISLIVKFSIMDSKLKWQFELLMLMLILLNNYMFIEVMKYLSA